MLLFSQRCKLQELFLKWCAENDVASTPMSVFAFLQENELIDENKTSIYLKENGYEVHV